MRKTVTLLATMLATTTFAQGVIDMHCHLLPTEFVEALNQEGRLLDEGFPLPQYDAEAHETHLQETTILKATCEG